MSLDGMIWVRPFQSTLSMRRATATPQVIAALNVISIHALHEESDLGTSGSQSQLLQISIHALHEESDFHLKIGDIPRMYFNPRSP